jgi:hypothetical protein
MPLDNEQDRIKPKLAVDFSRRTGSRAQDFNFARTVISSPDERTALLWFGVDYWADIHLNGRKLLSGMSPATKEANGCEFNVMLYQPVVLHLHPGDNPLFVKMQGGSLGSSFIAWLSDQPDLAIRARP